MRAKLAKIKDADTQSFLSEALECYKRSLYWAAVVLSWVAAISILYSEVVHQHLAAFTVEASKRDAKWRPAKNADGLAHIREDDFLNMIEALSVIACCCSHRDSRVERFQQIT